MPRFVAKENDRGGVAALAVLTTLGCSTASLNGDGTVDLGDVVFFTGDPKMHWPSKWLRIPKGQRRQNFVTPDWARNASMVIAVRPGKNLAEDGFKTAIRSFAESLGAVPTPPKTKKIHPKYLRRAYAFRPESL